jgi:hypothetical protein
MPPLGPSVRGESDAANGWRIFPFKSSPSIKAPLPAARVDGRKFAAVKEDHLACEAAVGAIHLRTRRRIGRGNLAGHDPQKNPLWRHFNGQAVLRQLEEAPGDPDAVREIAAVSHWIEHWLTTEEYVHVMTHTGFCNYLADGHEDLAARLSPPDQSSSNGDIPF